MSKTKKCFKNIMLYHNLWQNSQFFNDGKISIYLIIWFFCLLTDGNTIKPPQRTAPVIHPTPAAATHPTPDIAPAELEKGAPAEIGTFPKKKTIPSSLCKMTPAQNKKTLGSKMVPHNKVPPPAKAAILNKGLSIKSYSYRVMTADGMELRTSGLELYPTTARATQAADHKASEILQVINYLNLMPYIYYTKLKFLYIG